MHGHFVAAYHMLFNSVVAALFSATVLWKAIEWLYKKWQKRRENLVLSTFFNMDDGPWQSANGVVGELYLKAALSDAPGFFPPRLTGWRLLKDRIWRYPYRLRHFTRRTLSLPSKGQADTILRNLWERGVLQRADWDHTTTQYYRLRQS